MTYRAVLLDLDDTILDFHACVRYTLASGFAEFHLGEYREEEALPVFRRISDELWQGIEKGTVSFEEMKARRFPEFLEAMHVKGDGRAFEAYFREVLYVSGIPVTGAMELLQSLHGHVIVCAASNGPGDQQRSRLKEAGMLEYFDQLFISGDIGFSKPDSGFYACVLETLGREYPWLSKDEILCVGDSLSSDIAGGIQAGLDTCWYNPEHKKAPDGWGITHTIERLEEINALISGSV